MTVDLRYAISIDKSTQPTKFFYLERSDHNMSRRGHFKNMVDILYNTRDRIL